jgi:hypothetical protein
MPKRGSGGRFDKALAIREGDGLRAAVNIELRKQPLHGTYQQNLPAAVVGGTG